MPRGIAPSYGIQQQKKNVRTNKEKTWKKWLQRVFWKAYPFGSTPMGLIQWIDFQSHGDERGQLVALEIGRERAVPFDIKRAYYIYHTEPEVSRGFHAHRNLKQVAICVSGSFRMILDNGKSRESIVMDCPTKGLLIESMVWREMHDFSSDCVLIVLASEHYDESDYIRDYPSFLQEAQK